MPRAWYCFLVQESLEVAKVANEAKNSNTKVCCIHNSAAVLQSILKHTHNRTLDHSGMSHNVTEWHDAERHLNKLQTIYQIAKNLC